MEYSYSFHFIPWLLILISSRTALSSGKSNSFRFPRLSIRPPKWRGQESAAPNASFLDEYDLYEYNQTLDHFSFRPESFTKFKQRYVVNLKHWGGAKSKSPIFVYLLGAEESVIEEVMVVGLMHENAPEFKAMIAFIEHRFYGESIPFGWPIGRALKHKQVRAYLSTAQVLADYAQVILYLKQKYSADLSPVVVFGGSYGGMLAAWFRLKYPHVAMGALASSAPILHHINDHYFRFMARASQDYKDTSESCFWTLKKALFEFAKVGSHPNGLARLSKKFNLCSLLKNATALLNNLIVPVFRNAAQYDNPPAYQVETACKAIDAAPNKANVLDKLFAALIALKSGFSKSKAKCFDPNDYQTDQLPDYFTSSYTFESCMELIHQEGVASNNTMFPYKPFSLNKYVTDCVSNYRTPTRALYWFSEYYGGKHIQLDLRRFGSNIVFSNGLRDPWSLSGVLQNISDTLVAVTHPAAHCLDLQFSAKTDPKWLSGVRKKEMAIIQEWLSTYYADLRSLHLA